MHVCEICLFLLCEYWDMSLFVCESRVTLCGCVVSFDVFMYGWVPVCFCLFLYCVYPLLSWRPAGVLGWGSPPPPWVLEGPEGRFELLGSVYPSQTSGSSRPGAGYWASVLLPLLTAARPLLAP